MNPFKSPFYYGHPTDVSEVNSCIDTLFGSDPFWKVKLPNKYRFEHVYLLSRKDNDWNAAVGVKVSVGFSDQVGSKKLCGITETENKLGWHKVTCKGGLDGDTIYLEKEGKRKSIRFCGIAANVENMPSEKKEETK